MYTSKDFIHISYCCQAGFCSTVDIQYCHFCSNLKKQYNALSTAGKTHTMLGTSSNPGVVPRVINGIFEQIQTEKQSSDDEWSYNVTFSYLEIYNEKVCQSQSIRLIQHFDRPFPCICFWNCSLCMSSTRNANKLSSVGRWYLRTIYFILYHCICD